MASSSTSMASWSPSRGRDVQGLLEHLHPQGCPVDNVSDGTINCTCHGSQFSIEDGSVVGGPPARSREERHRRGQEHRPRLTMADHRPRRRSKHPPAPARAARLDGSDQPDGSEGRARGRLVAGRSPVEPPVDDRTRLVEAAGRQQRRDQGVLDDLALRVAATEPPDRAEQRRSAGRPPCSGHPSASDRSAAHERGHHLARTSGRRAALTSGRAAPAGRSRRARTASPRSAGP